MSGQRKFEPNPEQTKAIEHVSGPMLVVAGAGTGKTTVLAERYARLMATGHARAGEILAVTYTEEATKHLRAKIIERLRANGITFDPDELRVSTFHAYCFGLLECAGRGFRVLDQQDYWIYLRRQLDKLPLKLYLPPRDPGEFLAALLGFFSRCQDELVDARKYAAYVEGLCASAQPSQAHPSPMAGERVGHPTDPHLPKTGRCGAPSSSGVSNVPLPRVLPAKKDEALSTEEKLKRCREIAAVFAAVEGMLARDGLGTYGDMISGAVRLLREDGGLRQREQQRTRFLLMDEFQDANVAQIELAKQLGGTERNVFAVGDPDQAIYRFRGASSAAFEEFLKRFPDAAGVVIKENQRCTWKILRCAYAIIRANPEVDCSVAKGVEFRREELVAAREKQTQTSKIGSSGAALRVGSPLPAPVEVVVHGGREEEAADIAKEIRAARQAGYAGSMAVLYRSHKHRLEVMRELATEGVPFVVRGADALETPEARDLVAALGAVASLGNSEDLFRVSALPIFGVDAMAVREELARSRGETSYTSLLRRVPGGERVMTAVEGARTFAAAHDWRAETVCDYVIREFGFCEPHPSQNQARVGHPRARVGHPEQFGLWEPHPSQDQARVSHPGLWEFRQFVSKWHERPITSTGTVQEFIEYLGLFREAGGTLPMPGPEAEDGAVQLMTVHSAKGLEFDRVFVVRVGSASFPPSYREEMFEFPAALREMAAPGDTKTLHGQEERRLFYVAMTRARDILSVHAKRGTGKKDPSPPGYGRELLQAADCRGALVQRMARPFTATIHASAPASGVAAWLSLAPSLRVDRPLSATTIDAYATCPLKYKLMVDWRVPGPVSAALIYGNVMHTVLRDYNQALQAGRPRTEGEVLALFQQEMAAAKFEESLQQRLYAEQGAKQLLAFLAAQDTGQRPVPHAAPTILHVETDFSIRIAGVPVKGRMDRVDRDARGLVRVIDYKTGSAYTQEKANDSLQLTLYALAARQAWALDPAELVIYNLEDNSEVVTFRDAADFAAVEEQVTSVAEGIRRREFEAREGFHCQWCEYRGMCPAKEQALEARPS